MNTIEKLLVEVSAVYAKYDLLNKKTGGYFNIFDITGISTDEVTLCRVIYELINPAGSHNQGDLYLRLFAKYVMQMQLNERDYQTARVYREYSLDNQRRIDIAVETTNHFIPIEVKIYAADQVKQCHDYYGKAKNAKVIYLTLFGHPPSNTSAMGLTKTNDGYKEVHCASLKNELLLWLYKCLEQKDTIRIAPIREILLQLISIVRRLTDQLEEGMTLDIQRILMSSKENMSSAVEIEKSLKVCKTEMLWKVFRALESAIEQEIGLKKLDNGYDYNGTKVSNYYDHKGPTYPGITYEYKPKVKEGVDIWFRVEMGWYLFAGFCVPYHGQFDKQQLTDAEIRKLIPHREPRILNWWAYWEYLPVDNKALSPNFKTQDVNDVYFELYNSDYFNDFIAQCITSIKKLYVK